MVEPILTVEQVAGILAIHPETVRRLIRQGKIKAFRVGAGWRIPESSVQAYLEGGATGCPDEPRNVAPVPGDDRLPEIRKKDKDEGEDR